MNKLYLVFAILVLALGIATYVLLARDTSAPVPRGKTTTAETPTAPVTAAATNGSPLKSIKPVASIYFRSLNRIGPLGEQTGKQAAPAETWDFPPSGYGLAGFEFTLTPEGDSKPAISSLRAIFRHGSDEYVGLLQGRERPPTQRILAQPGFEVSQIEAVGKEHLQGMRLTFLPEEGGHLVTEREYSSDWMGAAAGDNRRADSGTQRIIGVSTRATDRILSMSLFFVPGADAKPGPSGAVAEAFPAPGGTPAESATVATYGSASYELYLNGVPVLRGERGRTSYVRSLVLNHGDVLAARMQVKPKETGAFLNVKVTSQDAAVRDLGDFLFTRFPAADWKTSPDLKGWQSVNLTPAPPAPGGSGPDRLAQIPKADDAVADYVFLKAVVP